MGMVAAMRLVPPVMVAICKPSVAVSCGAVSAVPTVMALLACTLRLPAASTCSTFRVWAPALKDGVVNTQPPV